MKTAAMKVELIEHMGSDITVCNAARVSFAKKSEWETHIEIRGLSQEVDVVKRLSERDTKLIQYLAKHQHWTPFSHPQLSFRIKAPLFVSRQWFKHQIGITRNEQSRRYVSEEPEFYIPSSWRTKPEGSIKQGSGGNAEDQDGIDAMYGSAVQVALGLYNQMLDEGIAPEQARMILPQCTMTEWVETASLAAVCRACKLRLDQHAQAETREIAEQIAEIVAPLFPVSWSALMEV